MKKDSMIRFLKRHSRNRWQIETMTTNQMFLMLWFAMAVNAYLLGANLMILLNLLVWLARMASLPNP